MPGGTRELTNSADFPRVDTLANDTVLAGATVDGAPVGIPGATIVKPAELAAAGAAQTAALLVETNARTAADVAANVRITDLEDAVNLINVALASGAVVQTSWAGLAAITGTLGQRADVVTNATTTHTDPVVGGTVLDQGLYAYDTSPAGWERIGESAIMASLEAMGGRRRASDTHAGLPVMVSHDGRPLVVVDPAAGPVRLTGDRNPNNSTAMLTILVGQSVASARQTASQPALNRTVRAPNRFLMFKEIGLTGLHNTDVTTFDLRRVVAAKEIDYETRSTGMILQILDYQDRLGMPSEVQLVANCAWGGAAYSSIQKGTIPFDNILAIAVAAKAVFGKIRVRVVMDLGETNSADALATYQGYMQDYWDDLNDPADGLPFVLDDPGLVVPLYLNQTPATLNTGAGEGVAMAQIALHKATMAGGARKIYMLSPRYAQRYGDTYHPAAYGQERLGSYNGQDIALIEYEGDNDLLYMTGATRSGNVITVATNAVKNLALDVDPNVLRTAVKYGFVVENAGTPQAIVGDPVIVGTTIQITMSANPTGWKVRYALDDNLTGGLFGPGGFGNIREVVDATTPYSAIDKVTPLPRWLAADEITVV